MFYKKIQNLPRQCSSTTGLDSANLNAGRFSGPRTKPEMQRKNKRTGAGPSADQAYVIPRPLVMPWQRSWADTSDAQDESKLASLRLSAELHDVVFLRRRNTTSSSGVLPSVAPPAALGRTKTRTRLPCARRQGNMPGVKTSGHAESFDKEKKTEFPQLVRS